jgi:uncharacterized protein
MSIRIAVNLIVALTIAMSAGANGVFLSKSEGFEHTCIRQEDGRPSHVDKILTQLLEPKGIKLLCTKDAARINAEELENYELVIFYTQGDISVPGQKDDGEPMGPNGVADLIAWIEKGGAFVGFHCASDTFHSPPDGPVTPYLEMLGGEFVTHGAQFEGTLKVVDPSHPTMVNVPQDFKIYDEWYLFRNFNKDTMHVLALLDPGDEREKQEKYNVDPYPVIWCSTLGEGRVFYNALGHREDVWENPVFQQHVLDAVAWALGQGPAQAEPNFNDVVPAASAD